MPLNDPAANGKPHPRSFVRAPAMQVLEKSKNSVKIAFVKADTVIFNEDVVVLLTYTYSAPLRIIDDF
jgi:hypothetical protein